MTNVHINPQLFMLVLAIVFVTWFVFLELCSRLANQDQRFGIAFWIAGPVFLGLPVWAIYFIARLTINVPILVSHSWLEVLVTVFGAMLICLIACLVVVRFTQQVIIQIVLSAVIVIMFIGLHFATLHIESGKNWWGRSEDLELVFFSGLIATYILLRAAALLKDGDYTRHIISAMVVTGL
ncbi:MAG: hypothetical protein D6698_04775, partial [Gammaproteobacteria bacterium]